MFHGGIARVLTLVGALVVGIAAPTRAGFQLVSQQAEVDLRQHEATFFLTFTQPPDFHTRDALGRLANSFQYEIRPTTGNAVVPDIPLIDVRSVVRGDEISGNMLPVRNGIETARDTNPAAGGWGSVRGSVPFTLSANRLTFTAPLQLLDAPSGDFAYRVFTTEYGLTTSAVTGAAVPLPPAAWMAFAALPLLLPALRRSPFRPRVPS